RLRGEPDLAEEPLRSAARKIEYRVRILGDLLRVADDWHDGRVFDVEQRARRLLRQSARHRLVDKMDDLRLDRAFADRGGRPPRLRLRQSQCLYYAMGE